jgi:isocitrate/isopropylmalate dehydrogenase
MMLRYLHLPNFAERMEHAIFTTLASGLRTKDVGGSATTAELVEAICRRVQVR